MITTKKANGNILVAILLMFTVTPLPAAAQYALDPQISFIYISGTSTLHDWTVVAEQMRGFLNAETQENRIKKIDSVQISIPVTSLKSSKKGMDENIYKALKSDRFPEIRYRLKNYRIEKNNVNVTGELTIAGVSKTINSKVSYQNTGNHLKFNGELIFNMTDFNIKPPEFLLGAFKTGDKIVIRFYFMFCDNTIKN